jgi:hypothetical protein
MIFFDEYIWKEIILDAQWLNEGTFSSWVNKMQISFKVGFTYQFGTS